MHPRMRQGLWTIAIILLAAVTLLGTGCSPSTPDTQQPEPGAGADSAPVAPAKVGAEPAAPAAPAAPEAPAVAETPAAPKAVGGAGTIETIGEGTDALSLVRVSGTRYEMGFWYGKLLGDQIAETWTLVQALAAKNNVTDETLGAVADALWQPAHFDTAAWTQELEGIAAGCADAGHDEITFRVLQKISAIPDLSESGCSLFAAWGKATKDGEVYQMRNLDWAMDTGFQDYPVVTIYEPVDGARHAVVGFAGVVGAVVGGMSEYGLAVSEIQGHFCDEETLQGIPFPVLLRDVLYLDKTLDEALARMRQATRTNQYHYGLADPKAPDPQGRLLFTSKTRFDEIVDNQRVETHPCEDLKPFHETLDDVVYWKNHNGRGNEILFNAIKERYGAIDAETSKEIAVASGVDGTLVSIIYHNSGDDMWVAFAEGADRATNQQFVHVSLGK